jgi:hypothetical protein
LGQALGGPKKSPDFTQLFPGFFLPGFALPGIKANSDPDGCYTVSEVSWISERRKVVELFINRSKDLAR